MEESILKFNTQFSYVPKLENGDKLKISSDILFAGRGGSNLSAGLLGIFRPFRKIYIHKDYGLPPLPPEILKEVLFIASSYSGDTEETLDAFHHAMDQGMNTAVIAGGGRLLKEAKEKLVPYIELPNWGLQPRAALGLSFRALLALSNEGELLSESAEFSSFDADSLKRSAAEIAESLRGKIPLIYTSSTFAPLSYVWKIAFNETGKTPAFVNVFPELNHNEMNGFDLTEEVRSYFDRFHFIFLQSKRDHRSVLKRMEITQKILESRSFSVTALWLTGKTLIEEVFSSVVMGHSVALELAKIYGRDPNGVPLVAELKKRMDL